MTRLCKYENTFKPFFLFSLRSFFIIVFFFSHTENILNSFEVTLWSTTTTTRRRQRWRTGAPARGRAGYYTGGTQRWYDERQWRWRGEWRRRNDTGARERWWRHVEHRVRSYVRRRPSRSGSRAMYAQRVLNSDPFTRHRFLDNTTANRTEHHHHHHHHYHPWQSARVGGGAGAAHRHTRILIHLHIHTHTHTRECTHAEGWGTRWQQCVTDRPAHESRSSHSPTQL